MPLLKSNLLKNDRKLNQFIGSIIFVKKPIKFDGIGIFV